MSRGARRVLGVLLGFFVRAWVASLRVKVIYEGWSPSAFAEPWVLAFSHGQQLALLGWRRRRETLVLVSLSDDGELQAGVMAKQGLEVVRGSTSRGGARGLAAIVRAMRKRAVDAAFAIDGPRGPMGVVQGGALVAATRTDGWIVPMASAGRVVHVLTRAWDRFEIPLPFTRVVVVLAPPIDAGRASPEIVAQALVAARRLATAEVTA